MFHSIEAKNLFSWENLKYEIPSGVSQIVGFNHDDQTPEGSGKSSVPNILAWTLYGKIPKEAKVDEVIREGEKSGLGKVWLIDGHIIHRRRKPNQLWIETPAGEKIKGKDAKETQKLINELVGMDFETFCQVIYFAQNYPKKFIDSNESDKAKIISDIEDLTIYDRAAISAKTHMAQLGVSLQLKEREVMSKQSQINVLQGKAETLAKVITTFQAEKEGKLELLHKKVDELGAAYVELEEHVPDLQALEEGYIQNENMVATIVRQLDATKKQINEVKNSEVQRKGLEKQFVLVAESITVLEKQLKKYEGEIACPTCSHPLSEEKKAEVCKEWKALEAQLDKKLQERDFIVSDLGPLAQLPDVTHLEKAKEELEKEYQELENRGVALNKEIHAGEKLQWELTSLKKDGTRIALEIKALEAETKAEEVKQVEQWYHELQAANAELKTLTAELNDIKQLNEKYDILRLGFKKVKAYVFRELLAELSSKASILLGEFFEVPVKIEFTNNKEGELSKIQTIVTINGQPRSLGLYSGGQYRRIALAVDLALAQIVANRAQKPINFRILDEPFKDLSETSMEKVVSVLERLGGSTIIIEHNPIVKSIIDTVFTVELRGGVTNAA